MRILLAVIVLLLASAKSPAADPKPFPGKVSQWHGFTRHDFQVDGAAAAGRE